MSKPSKKYFVTTSVGRNGYKITVEREFDRMPVEGDIEAYEVLNTLPHHFGYAEALRCLDWLDELPGIVSVTIKSRGSKFGVRYKQ